MENIERKLKKVIAKQAYEEIIKAITNLKGENEICCALPEFIDVDGERFFKNELKPLPNKNDKSFDPYTEKGLL